MNIREQVIVFNKLISRINGLYYKAEQDMGLNSYEVRVLYGLYIDEITFQKEIVEIYKMPKQTVNNIITALIKNGYVEAVQSAQDRRQKELRLTDAGNVYAAAILKPFLEFDENVAKRFEPERYGLLNQVLGEYAVALEQEINERRAKQETGV